MLAIKKSSSHEGKCSANVLPCRVNHNGSVDATKRYWNPEANPDGSKTAYFRGRKLNGQTVRLPDGYTGAVLCASDKKVTRTGEDVKAEELGDNSNLPETGETYSVMEEKATFEEIVVWGHEAAVDGLSDHYVRGLGEWVDFATQMHSF